VKQREHSDDQNVQLCTCLLYEQYSRWKRKKQTQKEILSHSIRVRHIWELVQYMDHTIPQSMGMKIQNPHYLSCTVSKANMGMHYPATLWCMWKSHCLWILPRKSYKTHMTSPETHVFIHTWWTQINIMMNINILMKNTTTFWCSSWKTQQHCDGQNVHPEFQVKVSGTQATWHNTIGHPPMATRAQIFYK
jgi:hypothetical protein